MSSDWFRHEIRCKKDKARVTGALTALIEALQVYMDDAAALDYDTSILVPIPKQKPARRPRKNRSREAWAVKAAVIRVQQAYWKILIGDYQVKDGRRIEEGGPLPVAGRIHWMDLLHACRKESSDGREIWLFAERLLAWAVVERSLFEADKISENTASFIGFSWTIVLPKERKEG